MSVPKKPKDPPPPGLPPEVPRQAQFDDLARWRAIAGFNARPTKKQKTLGAAGPAKTVVSALFRPPRVNSNQGQ